MNFGVGYDATDVAEAGRRGVVVSNTPDVLTACVADLAVGLVIDVLRRMTAADRFLRRGEWAPGVPALARRVTGARVGILGLGRIGRAIATRLAGFDAVVSYCNRSRRDDVPYAHAASPLELARGCDVLLVAAAGGEEGRIAGAGLDVFEDEPRVPEALLGRDDVVLLPHIGSATVETRAAMVDLVVANVESFLATGRRLTPVPVGRLG